MKVTLDDIRAVRDRWSDPVAKEVLDDLIAEFEEGDAAKEKESPKLSPFIQTDSRRSSASSSSSVFKDVVPGTNRKIAWDFA